MQAVQQVWDIYFLSWEAAAPAPAEGATAASDFRCLLQQTNSQ